MSISRQQTPLPWTAEEDDVPRAMALPLTQSGNGFKAKITTKRHSEGRASVFNLEPVHIELLGRSDGLNAVCTGTAVEVPGLIF
jgi:hypothetical protein